MVWSRFNEQIQKIASDAAGEEVQIQYSKFADASVAWPLKASREMKMSPMELANEYFDKIQEISKDYDTDLIGEITVTAPGYVNFQINYDSFSPALLEQVLSEGEDFGKTYAHAGEVLMEFPSVNPNKPWHVGHARNGIIGDTLANVLESVGYSVNRVDYIDDLGLQVAQTLWGTMNLPDGTSTNPKFDHYLGELYVEVHKRLDEKIVEGEVREIIKHLEEVDNEIARKGREMVGDCVRAQYETAYRLGIYHNLQVWESDIVESGLLEKALDKILKSDKIYSSELPQNKGCLVVDLSSMPEFGGVRSPEKILIRSDGTATYTAKDIAFQMWKTGLLDNPFGNELFDTQPNNKPIYKTTLEGEITELTPPDMVFNLIGSEQTLSQKVIRNIFDLLGYEKESEVSHHLSYEHVLLKGIGKMSGRKGTWKGVSTDELIDVISESAKTIASEKGADLTDDTIEKIAVGTFRYSILKTDLNKQIQISKEDLDPRGNTSSYVQYAYVRSRGFEAPEEYDPSLLVHPSEKALIKEISQFPSSIEDVVSSIRRTTLSSTISLSSLTQYAHDLAKKFSSFYDNCKILGDDEELSKSRLALASAYRTTIGNIMGILGLPLIDKM